MKPQRLCHLVLGLSLLNACSDDTDNESPKELKLRAQLDLAALETAGGNGSGDWGYTAPDGRRFALTGTSAGLSIDEVTQPSQPRHVALIPAPESLWREVKTFRNYVYVTTEATHGLDIIDLSDPDRPRKVQTWNDTFTSAHTLWIDSARQLLFANGTRNARTGASGMHVLDLSQNPEDPTELGVFDEFYIHDSYLRGTTLYASAIFDGFLAVIDVSNPRAMHTVNRWTTGGHFTHNSWVTQDGNFLFTTDEVAGRPLEGWDVRNPMEPRKVSEYISRAGTLPHNVVIDGDRMVVAHYGEGVHLLDVSDPERPQKLGSYDTYAPAECPGFLKKGSSTTNCHGEGCGGDGPNAYCGAWGAYIFPGTDTVIASDMQGGLFVMEYAE